ncbi:hypothetical protein C8R47DRAFT_189578 [Mycena vitilis]|nr:hypothetical protein C8R47DRAFT_189578 [Mycena vitilis]
MVHPHRCCASVCSSPSRFYGRSSSVYTMYLDVPASIAFLRVHGLKLVRRASRLRILVQGEGELLRLCPNLNCLGIFLATKGGKLDEPFPENSFAASAPHTALAELRIDFQRKLELKFDPLFQRPFELLDSASFPLLRYIVIAGFEWPSSEALARKNRRIKLLVWRSNCTFNVSRLLCAIFNLPPLLSVNCVPPPLIGHFFFWLQKSGGKEATSATFVDRE